MGATRRMHVVPRIHAVCVVKGVWNSCCETRRSSLLCPGSLWSDNSYLSTLTLFSHFFSAHFLPLPSLCLLPLYCLHFKCEHSIQYVKTLNNHNDVILIMTFLQKLLRSKSNCCPFWEQVCQPVSYKNPFR